MCIYKIQNMLNGKTYIGLTKNKAKYRWNGHSSKTEASSVSLISLAIAKHGEENFDFSVIDIVENQSQLGTKEAFWIKELNTLAPFGYNLTSGGDFPEYQSDITRERHKVAAKARWDNPDNKYHTEEYKVNRRVILKKFQDENPDHLKKARAINIANNTGKPFTPERCANISKSLTGRTASVQQRINFSRTMIKGFEIHCSNGEVYKSMLEASLATGVPNVRVTEIVKKRRLPLNGFDFWKTETTPNDTVCKVNSSLNANNT